MNAIHIRTRTSNVPAQESVQHITARIQLFVHGIEVYSLCGKRLVNSSLYADVVTAMTVPGNLSPPRAIARASR